MLWLGARVGSSATRPRWTRFLPSSKPLFLSAPALADLAGIAERTARAWGDAQKRTYLDLIKEKLALLQDNPEIGAERPDIAAGLRAMPAGRHMVFYRNRPERIDIVRILHQSMDPTQHMEDDA